MTAIRHWLATLSVFAFGGITYSNVPAEAATKTVTVAEIERACDRALQANTIEALEDFLHKYPPEKYRHDVACYALALGTLNNFGKENDDKDEHTETPPGGYGS